MSTGPHSLSVSSSAGTLNGGRTASRASIVTKASPNETPTAQAVRASQTRTDLTTPQTMAARPCFAPAASDAIVSETIRSTWVRQDPRDRDLGRAGGPDRPVLTDDAIRIAA